MTSALPLSLTGARLLAPLLLCPLILLTDESWRLLIGALFTVAAVTDSLDGWMARRLKRTSRWGEILDPIADKILVLLVLLALVARGDLPDVALTLTFLIFARELLMAGLREGVQSRIFKLQVSRLSRGKTFLTYVACGLLILGEQFTSFGTLVLGLSLIPGFISLAINLRRVL